MNRKRSRIILLTVVCLTLLFPIACSDSDTPAGTEETSSRSPEDEAQANLPENDEKVTVVQGVWGNVWFWEGNHMPSPDEGDPSGTITPVEREIYITETAMISDAVAAADPGFYSAVNTTLIATATSDSDGFYEAALPPGSYSVFIRENGLFYADSFSGNGEIGMITVEPDQIQKYQIDITYQATF